MRANLRAHYYASLGFQGAELKPALETILKENVVGKVVPMFCCCKPQ